MRTPLVATCCLALMLGAAAGCGSRVEWLGVERIEPSPDPETGRRTVFLNQDVVVHFTAPIDPMSVTPQALRVVDGAGNAVPGSLRVGTRSVRFRPRPPVAPSLDDGSLRPGGRYRLEIAGMPTSYAVRSESGRPLARAVAVDFEVPADPTHFGLETPFLPLDAGSTPFALDLTDGRLPRLAADERSLKVNLSLPPLPSSVTPAAVAVVRLDWSQDQFEELTVSSVRVLPVQPQGAAHYGATIELRFPESVVFRPEDLVYLVFAAGGADTLRDYRGRPLIPPATPLRVLIDPGADVELAGLQPEALRFQPVADAVLGLELADGRIRARARREAGDGRDGPLRVDSGTMQLGGGGTEGRGFQYTSIVVARGAELRIRAGAEGVVLRSCGDVRIDGRLVLSDSRRLLPWGTGDRPDVDSLLRASGVAVIAGGACRVRGEVVAEPAAEGRGSPWTLIAAGAVELGGEVPAGTAVAVEPGGRVGGVATSLVRYTVSLTPGVPPGARLEAGAWTQWLPLPARRAERLQVTLEDARGGMTGMVQLARARAEDPDRPLDDPRFLQAPLPLPLSEPLQPAGAAFLRVLLRGTATAGAMPSVAGVRLLEAR